MAIFKAPRITTAQRLALVLQASEIVYDLDTKSFFGGNGVTLGGFPLGAGASGFGGEYELITLTQENIDNKSITISRAPLSENFISVEIIGGITQLYGVDYEVAGTTLSWDGLGLDGFVEVGDIIVVNYIPFIGGVTGGALQIVTLTLADITNKFILLDSPPPAPEDVKLEIVGGISQLYDVDYIIGGNILSWDGRGLDGFVEVGDILIIQY